MIACTDCELPIPESFGAAASHVVVLRCCFLLSCLIVAPTRQCPVDGCCLVSSLGCLCFCRSSQEYITKDKLCGSLRRSKGNFATPAVAADVARLVLESGIRLIVVLGHTHCTAIDVAVERWLEKRASAWPWAPRSGAVTNPVLTLELSWTQLCLHGLPQA